MFLHLGEGEGEGGTLRWGGWVGTETGYNITQEKHSTFIILRRSSVKIVVSDISE